MAKPSAWRYRELYRRGKRAGLTRQAAELYATLTWWGEWYGIEAAPILSGKRSPKKQEELRRRWDRGDRAGLSSRPAEGSLHLTGEAFDLRADWWTLEVYGSWAPHAGGRWGGTFRAPSPNHFDTGRG